MAQLTTKNTRRRLRKLQPLVEEARRQATYKPTVTVVLLDGGAVCLGRSVKSSDVFPVPKGGIEERESILRAALREASEELGCGKRAFRVVGVVGIITSTISDEKQRKHGFSKGKLHIVLIARLLVPRKRCRPSPSEIAEIRWIDSLPALLEYTKGMAPLRLLRLWLVLKSARVPFVCEQSP